MASITPVNIGSAADAGDGDPLRTAFDKLNDNDDAINTELGLKLGHVIEAIITGGDGDVSVDGAFRSVLLEYNTALSAPRTVTLVSAGSAEIGDTAFVYRTANSTGSPLTVTGLDASGTGEKSLDNADSFLIAVYRGASNKWRLLAYSDGLGGPDAQTAAEVPFTPAGNLSSEDVQEALEELDTSKVETSDLPAAAIPINDVVYPGDDNYSVDGTVRKLAVEYSTPLTTSRIVTLTTGGSVTTGDVAYIYRTATATGSGLTVAGLFSAGTSTKTLNVPDSFLLAVYDGGTNKWRILAYRDQVATDRIAADAVDNTRLSNMPAWSFKVRNSGSTGDPEDADLGDISEEGSPAGGHKLVGFLGTGELRTFDVGNLPTAGGGESNTASNEGTDGVGVFWQKDGINLEFRHVAPASNKITVTLNGQDIDLDVAEANLAVTASQVSDSTTAGRALLTAADVAAQQTALNIEDDASADQVASEVPFTPAGDIAATDVQAAIEELDSEKAAVSHEHAAADITSGTLDDARVAESNVTQHEAALTVTESQISDLGTYLQNPATTDLNMAGSGIHGDRLVPGGTQAGTTYTLLNGDRSKLTPFTNGAGCVITIPDTLAPGSYPLLDSTGVDTSGVGGISLSSSSGNVTINGVTDPNIESDASVDGPKVLYLVITSNSGTAPEGYTAGAVRAPKDLGGNALTSIGRTSSAIATATLSAGAVTCNLSLGDFFAVTINGDWDAGSPLLISNGPGTGKAQVFQLVATISGTQTVDLSGAPWLGDEPTLASADTDVIVLIGTVENTTLVDVNGGNRA